jgi:hypothetical protein
MIHPMISSKTQLALETLADTGQQGSTDPMFLARFTRELLDLVSGGLATVEREIKRDRGYPIEIARVRITDAGVAAIESCVGSRCH